METDAVIQTNGLRALIEELSEVGAERFINLITKQKIDYTIWRQVNLNDNISVRELSKKAMEYYNDNK